VIYPGELFDGGQVGGCPIKFGKVFWDMPGNGLMLQGLGLTGFYGATVGAERNIIVNGCEVLSFKATSRDDAVHLNIDGNQWLQIQPNDLVSARLSKKKIRIIKPTNSDYYSILRQKLKWGDSVL